MAAQRSGANLYRSGLLAPIDGGKAMLPGILSRVGLTSALDGLGGEFCPVRHSHTGEYSLLLSCQPQGASLADDDVEDSYVASWAGLMGIARLRGRCHPIGRDRGHGTRFRRAFPPHAEQRIVEDAPEPRRAPWRRSWTSTRPAALPQRCDAHLGLSATPDRDGRYRRPGRPRRISLLLPSIREQIAQAGGGAARALGMEEITRAWSASPTIRPCRRRSRNPTSRRGIA